ncbi:hypothetical protein ACFVTP_03240 [Streptomyces celluloflavus]|uniref:hypothetical protein n=1 Tax=Streptomyces celluloflavus TaxID=58344 RepID=UPI0036DBD4DF
MGEGTEARAHRSMSALLPHMKRSRAITTARLARAQPGQHDVGPAVETVMGIPRGAAQHPRVAGMLTTFTVDLRRFAPRSVHTRTFEQHQRKAVT